MIRVMRIDQQQPRQREGLDCVLLPGSPPYSSVAVAVTIAVAVTVCHTYKVRTGEQWGRISGGDGAGAPPPGGALVPWAGG